MNEHEIDWEAYAHFELWAIANEVNIDNEDDWLPWYKCWLSGWNTAKGDK